MGLLELEQTIGIDPVSGGGVLDTRETAVANPGVRPVRIRVNIEMADALSEALSAPELPLFHLWFNRLTEDQQRAHAGDLYDHCLGLLKGEKGTDGIVEIQNRYGARLLQVLGSQLALIYLKNLGHYNRDVVWPGGKVIYDNPLDTRPRSTSGDLRVGGVFDFADDQGTGVEDGELVVGFAYDDGLRDEAGAGNGVGLRGVIKGAVERIPYPWKNRSFRQWSNDVMNWAEVVDDYDLPGKVYRAMVTADRVMWKVIHGVQGVSGEVWGAVGEQLSGYRYVFKERHAVGGQPSDLQTKDGDEYRLFGEVTDDDKRMIARDTLELTDAGSEDRWLKRSAGEIMRQRHGV